MPKIEVEIKKNNHLEKTIPQKIQKSGPQMRDIKLSPNKTPDFKKSIDSRVIEIKEEKEDKKIKIWPKVILPVMIFVVLIGVFFTVYYFLFAQKYQTLKFLPKETIFYIHINPGKFINNEKNKNLNLLISKFVDPKEFQKNIFKLIDQKILSPYEISFENDIKNNLSSELVFALYYNQDKKTISPYLIFNFKDASVLQKVINKISNSPTLEEKNLSQGKIYNLLFKNPALNFSYAISGKTAIISYNEEVLEKSTLAHKNKNYLNYQKSFFNRGNIGRIYLELNEPSLEAVSSNLQKYFGKKNSLLPYYAILKEYRNLQIIFKEKRTGISFLSIVNNKSGENIYQKQSLSPKLLSFIPTDAIFTINGNNLNNEYQDLKKNEILKNYFENFEKEISKKYNIKTEDLFALISNNEFSLILLPRKDNKQNFSILLAAENATKAAEGISKIESALTDYFSTKEPKEKKLKLEDGGEAIELLPDKKALKSEEEDFRGTKIKKLKNEKGKLQINLATKNDVIILSTDEETIKKIISSNKNTANFKDSKFYRQKYNNLLYLNVPEYLNYLGKPEASKNFWKALKNFEFVTKEEKNWTKGEGFLWIE